MTDRRSGAVEESKVSQLKISARRLVGRSVRSGAVEGSRAGQLKASAGRLVAVDCTHAVRVVMP